MSTRARNLAVLGLEVALLVGYVVAFAVFVTQSEDFIVSRNNGSATAAAQALPPTLPASYSFGGAAANNGLLGAGWHLVLDDEDGVWSKAPAYVFLPVPVSPSGLTLRLDGGAFLAAGHEQVEIALKVDGTPLGSWTATFEQPPPEIVVAVPGDATTDGLIELTIEADPLAVVEHYTDTTDPRSLGFFLRRILLTEPISN